MVKKLRLDFSKVEERSGWNTKSMPEGLHEMKIVGVEDSEAQDGTDMWVFALVPTAPRFKSRRFPYYCKLQQNQLWKLRDLFVAAGVAVPKKAQTIDPTKVVGKIIAAELVDETGQYEGRSSVNNTYGLDILEGDASPTTDEDEVEDDEEYDEEVEDDEDYEEDEEDEEEDEDLATLTLPELRKRAKGLGIDHAGVKKADLIEMILEAEAEEDDEGDEDDLDDEDLGDEDLEDEEFEDDEDEEDEEPEPAPRRRAPAKKPAAKAPAKAAPARRTVRRR